MGESENKSRLNLSLGLIVLLTISNIALITQNLYLRSLTNREKDPVQLEPKEHVTSFSGKTLDGADIEIAFSTSNRHRVFFYFSPYCSYCNEQMPIWKELLSELDSSRYDVFGLVNQEQEASAVKQYLKQYGLENLKIVQVPMTMIEKYKLTGTPTTLVVSGTGVVEEVWLGRWSQKTINNARQSLFVKLSGIASTTFNE